MQHCWECSLSQECSTTGGAALLQVQPELAERGWNPGGIQLEQEQRWAGGGTRSSCREWNTSTEQCRVPGADFPGTGGAALAQNTSTEQEARDSFPWHGGSSTSTEHQQGARGSFSWHRALARSTSTVQITRTAPELDFPSTEQSRLPGADFPSTEGTAGAAPAQHRAGFQSQLLLAQREQQGQHWLSTEQDFRASFPWHSSTSTAQSRVPEAVFPDTAGAAAAALTQNTSTGTEQDARGVFPGTAGAALAQRRMPEGFSLAQQEQHWHRAGCQRGFPWHSRSSTGTQQDARGVFPGTAGVAPAPAWCRSPGQHQS
ncbi:uncharacterized protein LOC120502884 [Passer montanus]|uniref:uncharacterized protein LOC120502884 n=1 Tax=Passer montanus TaxID=9160 RepID=UPI00196071DB|nr:uncharacterized protein LOC120502884 [Passer montanus]